MVNININDLTDKILIANKYGVIVHFNEDCSTWDFVYKCGSVKTQVTISNFKDLPIEAYEEMLINLITNCKYAQNDVVAEPVESSQIVCEMPMEVYNEMCSTIYNGVLSTIKYMWYSNYLDYVKAEKDENKICNDLANFVNQRVVHDMNKFIRTVNSKENN